MKVFLNGQFLPPEAAMVPAMDRGFLFGDGVYEVIPVYSRRPFRLAEHIGRLARSLAAVRIDNPHAPEGWMAIVQGLIDSTDAGDQSVYLQVTRGVAPVRSHAFPANVTPTVFGMTEPLSPPPEHWRRDGVSAISAADNRWLRCDIKATSLLANCLLRQMAIDAGCVETVMFRDGILTEGAAANIFVVKDKRLLAPQKNHLMLPGVTYDVVLELARRHGLDHEVRDILDEEVRSADEVWLSSSTREVLPIVRLDGRPIGTGQPGPVYGQMNAWYQAFKQEVMHRGG